ncbi:MAG: ATP-dependent Clp protease proteolytic subunit [Patescibacteria group bacterium]
MGRPIGCRIFAALVGIILIVALTVFVTHGIDRYKIKNELPFISNTILIFGEITDAIAEQVLAKLEVLDRDTTVKRIDILINSPGGSATGSFAICDRMKRCQKPVKTVVLGEACSGAAFILSSGSVGYRFAMPLAIIMVHRPALWITGIWRSEDCLQAFDYLKGSESRLFNLLSDNTSKSVEELRRDLAIDFYLTPDEAVNYGLIDHVLSRRKK